MKDITIDQFQDEKLKHELKNSLDKLLIGKKLSILSQFPMRVQILLQLSQIILISVLEFKGTLKKKKQ